MHIHEKHRNVSNENLLYLSKDEPPEEIMNNLKSKHINLAIKEKDSDFKKFVKYERKLENLKKIKLEN